MRSASSSPSARRVGVRGQSVTQLFCVSRVAAQLSPWLRSPHRSPSPGEMCQDRLHDLTPPHLRARALPLLGQGALVLPLQGASRTLDRAQRRDAGRVPEVREAAARAAGRDARRRGHPGLDADPRALRGAASRAVDPPARAGRRLRLGAARGVRRRVGQQVDVPLPLGARRRPDLGGRAASRARCMPRASDEQHAAMRAQIRERMVGPRLVRRLERRRRRRRSRRRSARRSTCSTRTSRRARTCSARARPSPTSGSGGSSTNAWTDPTPGALDRRPRAARARLGAAHAVAARRGRVRAVGTASSRRWLPLLERQVGRLFLPWSVGERGRDRRGPGGVHGRARRARPGRRSRRSTTPSRSRRCARATPRPTTSALLDAVLEQAGCLRYLR